LIEFKVNANQIEIALKNIIFLKKNSYFVLSSWTLFSQEQNKPKVGLVLSGGAKGFAHI
jgi:NTE family protein